VVICGANRFQPRVRLRSAMVRLEAIDPSAFGSRKAPSRWSVQGFMPRDRCLVSAHDDFLAAPRSTILRRTDGPHWPSSLHSSLSLKTSTP